MSELTPPPTRLRLFLAFTRVGLFGFGGAAALARQVVVEERRWLAERDYAELLPVGQILPGSGPSACPNLTEQHHRRTRRRRTPTGRNRAAERHPREFACGSGTRHARVTLRGGTERGKLAGTPPPSAGTRFVEITASCRPGGWPDIPIAIVSA